MTPTKASGPAIPQRRPPPPFPVTVLTGFLGAGKTTLLNRLLRDPALADSVVLINEFGEIGLDHLLVEAVEGDMILLASGCLCCSIRGDLIATLEDLLRRRDNGRMTPFRRVVIETTGLADPVPILQTLLTHPYFAMRFVVDGVVTLVDAVNGAATLDSHTEAVKQAAVADRIVLTKADLATPDQIRTLRARLQALNPIAPVLDAGTPIAAASLIGVSPFTPDGKIADVADWLAADIFSAEHDHGGHGHGDLGHHHGAHDVNRHDARIRAFCLRRDAPMPASGFGLFLQLLRQAHGPALLRVKGLVALDDDPARPMLIQGVQHVFHPPVRLERWPDADQATRIVFILRDLDPAFVDGLWNAFAGVPGIDRADAAALMANPLAFSGPTGLLG